MPSSPQDTDTSYTDEKGRARWRRNDEIARLLKELGDFLVIGGYEPSHATRYARLAYEISRCPESVAHLHAENRLEELPGVGPIIAQVMGELLETGTSRKMIEASEEFGYTPPPLTVLELIRIPGFGQHSVHMLYHQYGIDSLAALRDALDAGETLGLGAKRRENLREYIRRETEHGTQTGPGADTGQ